MEVEKNVSLHITDLGEGRTVVLIHGWPLSDAMYAEWAQMQERLAELRFYPDPQGQSICSYKFQDIAIDIMPAEDSSIGISNTWYKPGFKYIQQIELPEGITINILPSPYFLATKLEAFKDRGKNDFYGSHDFEDIIYLLEVRNLFM